MSELSETERQALKDSDFAYIDKRGGRHLPIQDAEHVRNAAARFDQTHFDSAAEKTDAARRIKAAASSQGVTLDPADTVMQAAE